MSTTNNDRLWLWPLKTGLVLLALTVMSFSTSPDKIKSSVGLRDKVCGVNQSFKPKRMVAEPARPFTVAQPAPKVTVTSMMDGVPVVGNIRSCTLPSSATLLLKKLMSSRVVANSTAWTLPSSKTAPWSFCARNAARVAASRSCPSTMRAKISPSSPAASPARSCDSSAWPISSSATASCRSGDAFWSKPSLSNTSPVAATNAPSAPCNSDAGKTRSAGSALKSCRNHASRSIVAATRSTGLSKAKSKTSKNASRAANRLKRACTEEIRALAVIDI